MKPVTTILYRVIGIPYYQRNAGFFLFLFIVLFGVVHGSELWYYHLSLAYAMIDVPLFMAVVWLVWLVYNFKSLQFVMQSLREPQHSFLSVMACLNRTEQLLSLFIMQLFLFLPVLMYSLFVIGVALYSSHYLQATLVVAYNVLLCFLSAVIYRNKINHPDSGRSLHRIPILRFRFARSFPVIFISHMLNDLKVVWLVTKLFSLIILIAFLNGYFIDVTDSRIPFLALLAGMVTHGVLVFEFRKFEETQLLFSRNLPVALWKRFFWIAVIYILVLIPEEIILVTSIPRIISPFDFILLLVFAIEMLVLFHCLLYWLRGMKFFLESVLGICAVIFFLILYKAYFVILSLLLLLSVFIFFRRYFYFENVIPEE